MKIVVGTVIKGSKEDIIAKIDNAFSGLLVEDLEELSDENPLKQLPEDDVDANDVTIEHINEVFQVYGGMILSEGWDDVPASKFNGFEHEVYVTVEE